MKSFADEIAGQMLKNILEQSKTTNNKKISEALSHINAAAEIFDSEGFDKTAEYLTVFLDKFSEKADDAAVKNLSSEKMLKNLKEKGWVFNADDEGKSLEQLKSCPYCNYDTEDDRHEFHCPMLDEDAPMPKQIMKEIPIEQTEKVLTKKDKCEHCNYDKELGLHEFHCPELDADDGNDFEDES